jgi:tRNA(fMet)-specific endonuclease VapC
MGMRRVLLDTNIYVAFKRRDMAVVEAFRHMDYIGMDITVLAELYSGFKCGKKEEQNRIELEGFINTPRVHLLEHDHVTAEFYSGIYLDLRKNGTPIPTNDIWIAAVAMQNGLAVFTKDQHFSYISGLMVKAGT